MRRSAGSVGGSPRGRGSGLGKNVLVLPKDAEPSRVSGRQRGGEKGEPARSGRRGGSRAWSYSARTAEGEEGVVRLAVIRGRARRVWQGKRRLGGRGGVRMAGSR